MAAGAPFLKNFSNFFHFERGGRVSVFSLRERQRLRTEAATRTTAQTAYAEKVTPRASGTSIFCMAIAA